MENELHHQYRELRAKGLKVKYWWFKSKSHDLMKELHPEVDFKFSMDGSRHLRGDKVSAIVQQLMLVKRFLVIVKVSSENFISKFAALQREVRRREHLVSMNFKILETWIRHLCLLLLIMERGMMTRVPKLCGIVELHLD